MERLDISKLSIDQLKVVSYDKQKLKMMLINEIDIVENEIAKKTQEMIKTNKEAKQPVKKVTKKVTKK